MLVNKVFSKIRIKNHTINKITVYIFYNKWRVSCKIQPNQGAKFCNFLYYKQLDL
jgi:hypothetical protein